MHGVLHDIQETYFIDAVIYTHSEEFPDLTQRRDAFTRPIKLGRGVFSRRSDNNESNDLGWPDETSPQIRSFQYASLSIKQQSLLRSTIKFHLAARLVASPLIPCRVSNITDSVKKFPVP